jgi:hypothetical protein
MPKIVGLVMALEKGVEALPEIQRIEFLRDGCSTRAGVA